MTEIICTVITGVFTVIVAMVSRQMAIDRKVNDERAELRKQETLLLLEMMAATMDLAEVSANALTNGHNNGNVEEARRRVKEARAKYLAFEHSLVAQVKA